MSKSQLQCLDEDVIFLPVSESSPEYRNSEGERYAIERLMNAGPEAFYSRLRAEGLVPFLSQEEVKLLSGWVQDYQITQPEELETAEDGGSWGAQDFASMYFPTHSDTPAPRLELGWPEKVTWKGVGNATVYTSPHVDGQYPVREILRRILQGASTLIAMVTDRLTDSAVIGDLHTMASHGVPVYIILNQRSIQETMNHHRLRHPNICIRLLGGNNFCSREGKMVVGEMKDNFLLVDLETVVTGSYSFTWSDAYLHRQLVTVLTGPVVESFDREFRILFAASRPVPDTWKSGRVPIDVPLPHSELLDVNNWPEYLPAEPFECLVPPPPTDTSLDWEAMGVINRGSLDNHHNNFMDMDETYQHFTAVNQKPTFGERNQPKIYVGHFSEVDTNESVRHSENKMETGPREEPLAFSSRQRKDRPTSRKDVMVDEDISEANTSRENSWANNFQPFRRPLILNVPESEGFSSLSDILRKLRPRPSSSAKLRSSKTTVTELSRSMMDLSMMNTQPGFSEKGPSVPQASYFDSLRMTPALALMKKRNDGLKPGIIRPTKSFLPPTDRPRSSSFAFQRDWRKPHTDAEQGVTEKK
ncbi:hypothetical protein UPYG_G00173950 [Umbra pygmaea]|uniref:Scaffolding anchor of CK1 domain-containing protein n=1 Tax=Umbra pygmaea TaxID=75934 RepID=A0ABD0WQ35_UMBPY